MDPTLLLNLQQALDMFLRERIILLNEQSQIIPPGEQQQDPIQISFVPPGKDFVEKVLTDVPAINCYLVGMAEDLPRRQSEPPRTQINDAQTARVYIKEPRFVDLTYMLTVWSKDEERSAEIEHLILGYLLAGLGGYDFIPDDVLEEKGIDPEPYGIRAQLFGSPQSDKVSGQVWQALGSTPKPTLLYSLSVPVPVHERIEVPVVQEINRLLENTST